MDQQTPTRYSDVAEWKLESSWWQGVSSDIKGCLSGRERKFLNGDLLLLFLITVFVIRLDNTITITGGQNSCGWSPVYWFFCYEWSVIYRLNNSVSFLCLIFLMNCWVLKLKKSNWPINEWTLVVKCVETFQALHNGNDVS